MENNGATGISAQNLNCEDLDWGQTWPSREVFHGLAKDNRVIPVAKYILADDYTPTSLYSRLAQGQTNTFIMESAEAGIWSRYSFVGVSARATLFFENDTTRWSGQVPTGITTQGSPIEVLESVLTTLKSIGIPGLPPMTGGLVGNLGWDFVRQWEPTIPLNENNDLNIPQGVLMLIGELAVFDHLRGGLWLISNAINHNNTSSGVDEAYDAALGAISLMQNKLEEENTSHVSLGRYLSEDAEAELEFQVSRESFEEFVSEGIDAIYDGEVFQIVLSQRIDMLCQADPLDVYRVLRTINPSSYMYYLNVGDEKTSPYSIVGSSPETLIKVENNWATTFPIAGSRPRGKTRNEDLALGNEILNDPKEIAEHIMLVDLARNDLAKVCDPKTVETIDFKTLRYYSHIIHLCSTVTGELAPGVSALQALQATFPAGTLSGAPKNRAIELINEIEPTNRGIYGGTVGYFSFDGNADMAIAIRTALIKDGRASVQAGAGIVADSVHENEYWESRNKAAAAVRAVQIANRLTAGED